MWFLNCVLLRSCVGSCVIGSQNAYVSLLRFTQHIGALRSDFLSHLLGKTKGQKLHSSCAHKSRLWKAFTFALTSNQKLFTFCKASLLSLEFSWGNKHSSCALKSLVPLEANLRDQTFYKEHFRSFYQYYFDFQSTFDFLRKTSVYKHNTYPVL